MATLFAITLHIKNEVTGEPHIHYYTHHRDEAQAATYAFVESLHIAVDFQCWALPEGTVPACYVCQEARKRISVASEYGW